MSLKKKEKRGINHRGHGEHREEEGKDYLLVADYLCMLCGLCNLCLLSVLTIFFILKLAASRLCRRRPCVPRNSHPGFHNFHILELFFLIFPNPAFTGTSLGTFSSTTFKPWNFPFHNFQCLELFPSQLPNPPDYYRGEARPDRRRGGLGTFSSKTSNAWNFCFQNFQGLEIFFLKLSMLGTFSPSG
ncbi:MAG: hypothetical protein DRP22_04460 [Verrucomicrobia bacterium]|nr:MAG: hypothetical protein DRP22_04460 [Verrucomicrobiota bacterium]